MITKQLNLNGVTIPVHLCHTLVVGSGAASLNCALHLYDLGVEDVAIVTERLGGGTSHNSGSDKQTYYKLSLFGDEPDSVYEMARTLFDGGCMHGDIALVEATLSPQEFYHLVQLGVPFPHNRYGGYVGYKTDHDPRMRATSAGPWTSRMMVQSLLRAVRQREIPILDEMEIIALLTAGAPKRVVGALGIDKGKVQGDNYGFTVFCCENVVFGTGGPGGLYKTAVYPVGHLGSSGVAVEAGAPLVNVTEWQYGLASTQFRWNVSGTYQQVIPRYISTDQEGGDVRQFLNEYFPTMGKLATAIFLKGYQWPFDPRKIANYGSSLIDLLVYIEVVQRGRRVFLDFRENPSGEGVLEDFSFEQLEPEAYNYLKNSQALFGKPIDRLLKMNPHAVVLYREHGIDLTKEPLEIAVCAQHQNGGLEGDVFWQSELGHFFPIGEANGTHGIYRPGGSALNSGQVGGLRAAQYIAHRQGDSSLDYADFCRLVTQQIDGYWQLARKALDRGQGNPRAQEREEMQTRMSKVAAHIRRREDVEQALTEAKEQWQRLRDGEVALRGQEELVAFFQDRQLVLLQVAVLTGIEDYLRRGGGSRGSYLVLADEGQELIPGFKQWRALPEREDLRQQIQRIRFDGEQFHVEWIPVRPIPVDDFWYENVWEEYRQGKVFG